jgi:putative CocE/NonD family hydrolase
MPYRDSISPHVGARFWDEVGVYRYEDVIEASGLAIYHWHNLGDEGRGEGMIAAENLDNPGFVLLGPGGHCEPPPNLDLFAEQLRFFDRYLKGVRNGIDDQPRYRYWTLGAPEGEEWSSAEQWPPGGAVPSMMYLRAEGELMDAPAPDAAAAATFAVDYDVTCPGDSYFIFGPCVIDRSGATFTSAPLAKELHIVGNPNATIWISSSVPSANLFAYLELVSPEGEVSIVSHGRLAAAYRTVSEAPYDTLGQPWHSGLEADQLPLAPGEVVEMQIALLPVSLIAPAGSRLRVTLAGADPRQRDLADLRIDPAPSISVHSGPMHPSRVELPIVGGRQ